MGWVVKLPVVLILDFGRFEISEDCFQEVKGRVMSLLLLLEVSQRAGFESEYRELLELIKKGGVALSFADARPPEFILPSPLMGFDALRTLFAGSTSGKV